MGNWTNQEVANKVDWEGGIIEALYWGLRSDDIADPDLSAAWAELETTVPPILDRIRNLLPEPRDEDDDE